MKLIFLTAAAGLSAIVALVLAGASMSAAGEKHATVRVMDNFFDPRSATIERGTRVTFVWKGTSRHNVRFTKVPAGASDKGSRTRRKGDWSRRFWKPGLYRYVCTIFDGMRGTITVKKPPPPPPS
jgi:plastocyanin